MEIKLTNTRFSHRKRLLMIIMRTFIFLFVTSIFAFTPNNILSQNSKIEIKENKTLTVDEVFKLIKNQTDYKFFYEDGLFDDFSKVHVKKGVIGANDLLKRSLSQGNFNIVVTDSNAVLIKEKPKSSVIVNQQRHEISGKITDSNGEPLPGANILEKGTNNGSQTDFDGDFKISVADENAVLTISYLGFLTKDVSVNGQTNLTVSLIEDAASLDEVVVIGYGTSSKKDATGAVDVVSTKDFNKGVVTSPDQLLQGRSAGVQVTTASGEPGSGATIRIRGSSSVRSGNNPLYVIDGVPFNDGSNSPGTSTGSLLGQSSAKNPLNFINSNDIESISILKDASSTAIYGSRAANGVIIITTKSGKRGEGKLNYSYTTTVSKVANEYNLLSASEFATANPTNDIGSGVNAFDEIKRTAITKEHNLSYSGGAEKGKYRVSLGLLNQEGVIKNTGLDKYTLNTSVSQKFFDDVVEISANLTASQIESEATALSETSGTEGDLLLSSLRWNPTQSFTNPDGAYVQLSENERNPLALLDYFNDDTETTKLFGNVKASINFTDDLKYQFTYGFDRTNTNRGLAISRLFNSTTSLNRGYANIQNNRFTNQSFSNTLSFDKAVNDNLKINAVVGHSYEEYTGGGESLTLRDFDFDDQTFYLNNIYAAGSIQRTDYSSVSYLPPSSLNQNGTVPSNQVGFVPISLQSFFARGIFNLKNKYILTATIRSDGSSRFGANNKYGTFSAFAAAWKIHEEEFLPEAFSNLKLRAGWGQTGNQQFNAGAAREVFAPLDGGGVTRLNIGNPDLKWETTTQLNFGLDFGINDGRLSGNVDYFTKNTDDLLFRLPVQQPGPVGSFSWANFSDEIINSGVEVGLNYKVVDNEDFSLEFGGNVSFLTNEINGKEAFVDFGTTTGAANGQGLSGETLQLLFDGQPLYAFYLPVFEGFDASGTPIYADTNGDGIVNTNFDQPGGGSDRAFVGDPNPDINIGLTMRANYKNWDLSLNGYGAYGHQIYNNTANALFSASAFNSGGNVVSSVVNNGEDPGSSPIVSTRFLESGDFFRLSNATIGFTLDTEKLGKLGNYLTNARFFVTGQNLFIITPYSGLDPEVNANKQVNGVPSFGIEYSGYPRARSFSFGLNLNF
ncbi:TonB-dependent receptor [uncultured Maribacter sp.]|uniref:SusC/RagA family TonB-linked outer membrane protein n=1 Tax=uncultured Maribacter sp. TaxID=431308 RepID=UPI002630239A|nr:TonB-dependent receptor [uncultured Maribacter sp.]